MSGKKSAYKQHKNSRRIKPTPASWKSGESGNPAGRPRSGCALAEVFRNYLDDPVGPKDTRSRKEKLAEKLYSMATGKAGSVSAARVIIDLVGNFELEARLQALEQRVDLLTAGGPRVAG